MISSNSSKLAAALLALSAVVSPGLAQGPIRVELFEKVPAGSEFELAGQQPVEHYAEPAFGFVRVPTKFSENAWALDRSTPFVLRATFERAFPAGDRQFRLRARGAAALWVDGKIVAKTKPQPPNLTGDDPVPPPPVHENSPLRPAPYPHQDAIAKLHLDGGNHSFVLVAIIGGKGLSPSPGELAVSTGAPGELERLLGPDGSPHLTDSEWEAYVAAFNARHRADDATRRHAASVGMVAAWKERHDAIRETVQKQPAPELPTVSDGKRVYNDIDRFIGARLEQAKVAPLALTSDLEFLRRVSIDTTGRIPTADDIRAYLADAPATRRARAIDRLLAESVLGRQLGELLAGRARRKSWHPEAGSEQHRSLPLVAASVVQRQCFHRSHGRRADRNGRQLRAGRPGRIRAGYAQRLADGGQGRHHRSGVPGPEAGLRPLPRCAVSSLQAKGSVQSGRDAQWQAAQTSGNQHGSAHSRRPRTGREDFAQTRRVD